MVRAMEESLSLYPDYSLNQQLVSLYELYMDGCSCDVQEDACYCLAFDRFCEVTIERLMEEQSEC